MKFVDNQFKWKTLPINSGVHWIQTLSHSLKAQGNKNSLRLDGLASSANSASKEDETL